MSTILAVDPSLRCTGFALFENAVLTRAGVAESHPVRTNIQGVHEVFSKIHDLVADRTEGLEAIVLEFPRIYPKGSKEKRTDSADPNDLLWVSAVAGALATLAPPKIYYPSDWKGQSKKEKTLRLVLQASNPTERSIIESIQGYKRHNAVDAVGIGMYHFRRIGKNLLKEDT